MTDRITLELHDEDELDVLIVCVDQMYSIVVASVDVIGRVVDFEETPEERAMKLYELGLEAEILFQLRRRFKEKKEEIEYGECD